MQQRKDNTVGMDADSISPLGDSALRVDLSSFGDGLNNEAPRCAWKHLKENPIIGVTDVSFSYSCVLIQYDPLELTYSEAVAAVEQRLKEVRPAMAKGRCLVIPVCYGGEFGPDLEELCAAKSLTASDLISLHSAPEYLISAIGFMPGFAYLEGMDPCLSSPRKSQPRLKIAPGSVGIAGGQTGIYPLESPGGWQIIGRTPINVFDTSREPAVLYQAGDSLRFSPISKEDFERIREEVDRGTFDYESVVVE